MFFNYKHVKTTEYEVNYERIYNIIIILKFIV